MQRSRPSSANAHDGGPHAPPPPLAQHPVGKGRKVALEEGHPRQKAGGRGRKAPRRAKGPPGIHQKAKADQVQEAHGQQLPQVQEQERQKDGGDRPQRNGNAAPAQVHHRAAHRLRVRLRRLRADGLYSRDGPPQGGRARQGRGRRDGRELHRPHAEPQERRENDPQGRPHVRINRPQRGQKDEREALSTRASCNGGIPRNLPGPTQDSERRGVFSSGPLPPTGAVILPRILIDAAKLGERRAHCSQPRCTFARLSIFTSSSLTPSFFSM